MAQGNSISGKVLPDQANKRKFKVLKSNQPQAQEVDVDIEIESEGTYQVERLSLPDASVKFNGQSVRWLTNFSIKEGAKNINKPYKVTIPGLATNLGNSALVIYYGSGNPVEYLKKDINGNTITLTNGDPSPGMSP